MWIVRLALRRPYTFAVVALLLMILGPLAIVNTPVDIFPNINIPVVTIVWNYTGFSPDQMASRIVTLSERSLTTTVNDIEHIESNSLNGIAVMKVYFQPGVNIGNAVAQITAVAQTQLRQLPARHHAASGHSVQRFQRAHHSAWPLRPGPLGTAAERPRPQFHSHPARHRPGRWHSLSLRRQAAPGPGRPQSARAPVQRPLARRRSQRHRRAEPHPAFGDHEDRPLRVPAGNQQRALDHCRA